MAHTKCNKKKNCNNKSCSKSCKTGNKKKATPAATQEPKITLAAGSETTTDTSISKPLSVSAYAGTQQTPSGTEDGAVTADKIQKSADAFLTTYAQYNTLRELAKGLNGLTHTSPIPDNVKIEKVSIAFSVDATSHTLELTQIKTVGELAQLLSTAASTLIEKMYQDIFSLNSLGSSMQQAIETVIVRPAGAVSNDKKV